MMRKAISDKMFVLGIDGLDPRLTRRFVAEGKMPNIQYFIERGAQREDLVMLGGHPTVTPPMWTTLATGAYANVHGITCFWRKGDALDTIAYNLDSRLCKAEQLWNVFAEAGKKTLVWHWPGSSWPPSSDSPNLAVVDGLSPGSVGIGVCKLDDEYLAGASEAIQSVTFLPDFAAENSAPCVISGLDAEDMDDQNKTDLYQQAKGSSMRSILLDKTEGVIGSMQDTKVSLAQSPITPAKGWTAAPEGAKEMTLLLANGLIQRKGLLIKNAAGIYDSLALYKTKKDTEPIAILPLGIMVHDIVDDAINKKEEHCLATRSMKLLEMKPDGSELKMYISSAMDIQALEHVCHPHSLYQEICAVAGYPPATAMFGNHDRQMVIDCMLDVWKKCSDYQSTALNYLMSEKGYEIVFSHYHIVDLVEHHFIRFLTDKGQNKQPEEVYFSFMEELYKETDRYIGQFCHLLDEGWTVFIVSDHAQVCSAHDMQAMGDQNGVSIGLMEELGLTAVKRDEQGNRLHEIDWEHTLAIAQRGNHIYVNLEGRDEHGIVKPENQYEVEEEIMTRLYGYRDKKTGKRVIALALRNKDAVLLGMGGPECGDIIYWMAEGYNFDHCDCLSTTLGEKDTSVSPIFIAAGQGLKQAFTTDRIIRQVDLVPTMAILGGVRMPKQCEGAPIYQILAEQF